MLFPLTGNAEPADYTIDPEHAAVSFEVMHLGYARVFGLFTEVEGNFRYDEQNNTVSSGTVIVESDSIFSNHSGRDRHLRSDDFLDARRHPEVQFTVTGFESTGSNTGNLTGELLLLGKSSPVTLDVTINKAAVYPIGHGEYTMGISAHTTLRRSDWGMEYGLDMVEDEVTIRVEIEAIRD